MVNTAPKKQAKKPHPPKVAKQQPKKPVVKPKQVVKVKIPKPTNPPKKRLPLEAAILQITTFWPNLFSENQLRPMKIGIQQLSQRTKDAFPIRNCFAVSRIVKPSAFLYRYYFTSKINCITHNTPCNQN